MKIIDIHAHIFPAPIAPLAVENLERHYRMPWSMTGTAEDIRSAVKEAGIYRAVIFSAPTKPSQVVSVNNFIISMGGGAFIPFGSAHPDYEDAEGEIRRVKGLGVRGFKFHPDFQLFNIDDDKALRMYELIGKDYPILLHTGDKNLSYSHPERMARALDIFPEHTFIAAHMGGYGCLYESQKHLVGKRIYFDTSSSFCNISAAEMTETIKAHGAGRILFGTDYPAVNPKEELERIMALPLTGGEREKILWSNAAAILRI